jgi:hypothetical protein
MLYVGRWAIRQFRNHQLLRAVNEGVTTYVTYRYSGYP